MRLRREVLAPKLRPVWDGVSIIAFSLLIPLTAATVALVLAQCLP